MKFVKQFLPRGKKELLSRAMQTFGVNHGLRHLPVWSGLLVVNYHRIGHPDACPFDRNIYSATAEQLEQQLQLYKQHADVISVSELSEALQARFGKFILVTFDDGYRDNYELAFPILRQTNTPAVFFIADSFIDAPRVPWWDEIGWMIRQARTDSLPESYWFENGLAIRADQPQQAISTAVQRYWSLPGEETDAYLNDLAVQTGAGRCPRDLATDLWMTWNMLAEVQQAGIEIGGHTVTHPILAQQSDEKQREEIFNNRDRLQTQLGQQPTVFAYPVGQTHMFTETTKAILREAGYQFAFKLHGNQQASATLDRFGIPRSAIDYGVPLEMLQARLTLPQLFAKK